MSPDAEYGRAIVAWRTGLGWSGRNLADRLGASLACLVRVERGRALPSSSLVSALAEAGFVVLPENQHSSVHCEIVPMTVKAARLAVKRWHRHLPDIQGGLFAAGVSVDGLIRGVAVAGNPARVWQGQAKLVISRVATDETKNACSALYGAMCRASSALGYNEAWTYTLPEESTVSLLASGFEDMGISAGGEHDRPSRRRRSAVRPDPKRRWRRVLTAERRKEIAAERAERAAQLQFPEAA
jgi:DNA-binding XRE family transcriptional regulator